jgi:aspartate racemase
MRMKKIGIVGGIAWQSTVLYYSELCRRSEERHRAAGLGGTPPTPEIVIESLNMARAMSRRGTDGDEPSWAEYDEYYRAALKRLEAAGADFACIASNTPHHRWEAITRGIRIPVISILDAMARKCKQIGARRVLLLGTGLTMESARFREEFAKRGIDAAGPRDEAMRAMTADLIISLQCGREAGAAEQLNTISQRSLESDSGAERRVVCLACTELPLAFESGKTRDTFEHDGTVYVNSSVVHVNTIFDFALDCP